MGELLGKNEQLTMRNFQGLSGRSGRCDISTTNLRFHANYIDPNRNALLQFDLANSDRTICTVEYTLHEASLRVTRPISKLWHRSWILVRNSQIRNSKFDVADSFRMYYSIISTASLSSRKLLCGLHND